MSQLRVAAVRARPAPSRACSPPDLVLPSVPSFVQSETVSSPFRGKMEMFERDVRMACHDARVTASSQRPVSSEAAATFKLDVLKIHLELAV